jgi:hypothetical protein
MIDLWSSRRDKFIECKYYSQNENDYVGDDEIAHFDTPTGIFFASEVGPKTSGSQVVAELFMVEEVTAVLKTEDDVSELKKNDIVAYEGKSYRVESVQKTVQNKQRNFLRKAYSATYYISLRG